MTLRLMTLEEDQSGSAWPAPVRVLRRPVKSGNERDRQSLLLTVSLGLAENPRTTAMVNIEEGDVKARSVCSYIPAAARGIHWL